MSVCQYSVCLSACLVVRDIVSWLEKCKITVSNAEYFQILVISSRDSLKTTYSFFMNTQSIRKLVSLFYSTARLGAERNDVGGVDVFGRRAHVLPVMRNGGELRSTICLQDQAEISWSAFIFIKAC